MWAKQGGSGGIRGKDMVQLPQADVFFAAAPSHCDSLQDDALQVLVVDGAR